jgi:hypothetical protein
VYDEGTIVGYTNLKIYIIKYYKKLFGEQPQNSLFMIDSKTHDVPQLSSEFNGAGSAHEVIFQMDENKHLGTRRIPIEFHQKFWDIINNYVFSIPTMLSTYFLTFKFKNSKFHGIFRPVR